jgi:hypothetical protein
MFAAADTAVNSVIDTASTLPDQAKSLVSGMSADQLLPMVSEAWHESNIGQVVDILRDPSTDIASTLNALPGVVGQSMSDKVDYYSAHPQSFQDDAANVAGNVLFQAVTGKAMEMAMGGLSGGEPGPREPIAPNVEPGPIPDAPAPYGTDPMPGGSDPTVRLGPEADPGATTRLPAPDLPPEPAPYGTDPMPGGSDPTVRLGPEADPGATTRLPEPDLPPDAPAAEQPGGDAQPARPPDPDMPSSHPLDDLTAEQRQAVDQAEAEYRAAVAEGGTPEGMRANELEDTLDAAGGNSDTIQHALETASNPEQIQEIAERNGVDLSRPLEEQFNGLNSDEQAALAAKYEAAADEVVRLPITNGEVFEVTPPVENVRYPDGTYSLETMPDPDQALVTRLDVMERAAAMEPSIRESESYANVVRELQESQSSNPQFWDKLDRGVTVVSDASETSLRPIADEGQRALVRRVLGAE